MNTNTVFRFSYVFILFCLYVVATVIVDWGHIDGLLVPDTTLHYGLFKVCGYDSYPFNISNCYDYNDDGIFRPLIRTNHLGELANCGGCDLNRQVAAAFAIMACLFIFAAGCLLVFGKPSKDDDGDKGGHIVFVMFTGVLGCISMAVWVAMVNTQYNDHNQWAELASDKQAPNMLFGSGMIVMTVAWALSIIYVVVPFDSCCKPEQRSAAPMKGFPPSPETRRDTFEMVHRVDGPATNSPDRHRPDSPASSLSAQSAQSDDDVEDAAGRDTSSNQPAPPPYDPLVDPPTASDLPSYEQVVSGESHA